jgi:hypothetical protein
MLYKIFSSVISRSEARLQQFDRQARPGEIFQPRVFTALRCISLIFAARLLSSMHSLLFAAPLISWLLFSYPLFPSLVCSVLLFPSLLPVAPHFSSLLYAALL